MTSAARTLFASLIDYAGTFPPAQLDLSDAMRTYAGERNGPRGSMLGRFALASHAIDEFESLAPAIFTAADDERPWQLAVSGTRDTVPDRARIAQFNDTWGTRSVIASVELGPLSPREIGEAARGLPDGIEPYFEISPVGDFAASLAAIASVGGRAKIRTGGVTSSAFPDIPTLAAFFAACRETNVAFKATAGLRHAVRGDYPLTYMPNSPRATMHGVLNVLLASALVYAGRDRSTIEALLREMSADAFVFSDAGVRWGSQAVTTEQLAECRRHFFTSLGSCAFGESIDEVAALGIVDVDGQEDGRDWSVPPR